MFICNIDRSDSLHPCARQGGRRIIETERGERGKEGGGGGGGGGEGGGEGMTH